ncbi:alpha/beta hydrolase [bacterium]|nr:alpha/beta hydrolase [bacterium]
MSWKRAIHSTALILFIVYIILLLYAYLCGDQLIFRPQSASYIDTKHIHKVSMPDGSLISVRLLLHPTARYTILYSHGNAEDLGDIKDILHQYYEHGFSVVAYDYSGYGTSQGSPSEETAYTNIRAVYEFIIHSLHRCPEEIILYGRSIGCGPTVDLASRERVGGIVLESAFTSAFRMLTKISVFPFDKFDSLRKIPSVSCPILVIHGKQDETIQLWHGQRLYEHIRSPKMRLWVEHAHHNDVLWIAGKHYWETMKQFIDLIEKEGYER